MEDVSRDKMARVYSRLVAIRRNLPLGEVDDKYVEEYHNLLQQLEPDLDVEEFKIPVDWVASTLSVIEINYLTGKSKYGKTKFVPRHLFLTKVDGLLQYFELLDVASSNKDSKEPTRD
jgi:hypothetical protein